MVADSQIGVIDCGIHAVVADLATLAAHAPARVRERLAGGGARGRGSGTPALGPTGADPVAVRREVFDEFGIARGVLLAIPAYAPQSEIEVAAAIASATNNWQIERWLEAETRLRGSIAIASEEADLAVAEIERHAGDSRFAQIQIVGRSRSPLGNPKYWPIYEAAANAGLPVAIHPAGDGDYPATGAGWPSFDLEERIVPACAMQANLVSLVCEGVFARFPGLRVLCSGAGFAWSPSLIWRLDASWRLLRDEVPDLTRPPSEYIREQVWWTTQPMAEPTRSEYPLALFDQFAFDDRLVFASGYPGPDFNALDTALPADLPEATRQRIARQNAIDLYRGRV